MLDEVSYFDISPEITESIAVWPGDVNFQRKMGLDFNSGGNICLSSIQTTVHLGAHTDAPNHYHPDGKGIESRDLNYYLGKCQVISVSPSGENRRILSSDLKNTPVVARRILFRTCSYPDANQWNDDFASLSSDLIRYLASQKVVLVGIDTPSVDPYDDKILETHQAIFLADMAILEGIKLQEVPDGIYTLVALPLRIRDADASPVRAILIKDK